jgi:hypothetical protein
VSVTDIQFERLQERVRKLEEKLSDIIKFDGSIVLSSDQQITIGVGSNRIVVDQANVTIEAQAGIKLQASAQILLSGAAMNLQTPMVAASGVIRCDTIMATNVMGANYTPGAGNIW